MEKRKSLTLEQIHSIECEALKAVTSICDDNNYKYFVFYGSLIGAIRHKGFIPWDDDVDIIMPRKDYEHLINYCTTHADELLPYKIIHYRTNKDYIYPIVRFCDSRYSLEYDDAKDYGLGVFVDIYPIDNCGNSMESCEKRIRLYTFIKYVIAGMGAKHRPTGGRNVFHDALWTAAYLLGKIINIGHVLRLVDKISQSHNKGKKYLANLVWNAYGTREIMVDTDFDNYVEVEFEGLLLKAPIRYDSILSNIYGDYMEYPPKDQRIPHHNYVVFEK